jgi:hypothetical protein
MKPMESFAEVLGEDCRVCHYLREGPHSHEARRWADSLHLSFSPARKDGLFILVSDGIWPFSKYC